MKAITICQPYAELILAGEKLVENRTWKPEYTGPLLIHAGKSRDWLCTYGPLPEHMDFGAIVGVCNLEICLHEYAISNMKLTDPWFYLRGHRHAEGPWCWVLKDVRRFPTPINRSGAQKLWDVPQHVVAAQLRLVNWI